MKFLEARTLANEDFNREQHFFNQRFERSNKHLKISGIEITLGQNKYGTDYKVWKTHKKQSNQSQNPICQKRVTEYFHFDIFHLPADTLYEWKHI